MTTPTPPTREWLDDESADSAPVAARDKQPETASAVGVGNRSVALTTRKGNNRRVLAFAAVLLAAIGVLVVKGLGTASTYFRTTDEAVAQVDSLGDRRFRIEGVVVEDSVRTVDSSVANISQGNTRTQPAIPMRPPRSIMPIASSG